jgi:hypothetical protein
MKWIFYILAGIFVAAGVYALLAALNFPAVLQGLSPTLAAVLGPIWSTLIGSLSSFVRWIGILLLVIALGISGLLVLAGWLLDGYLDLRARVARLEAELGQRGA